MYEGVKSVHELTKPVSHREYGILVQLVILFVFAILAFVKKCYYVANITVEKWYIIDI